MRRPVTIALNLSLAVLGLFNMAISASTCNEPPPCTDLPMSFMGEFDGILYDPDSGGQMFANWSELCVNLYDDVTHYTNIDDMQTVTTLERLQGLDVYIIYMGNFKYPYYWDGGAQILVFYDAALESYRKGTPIPLDGVDAIAYHWEKDYWDSVDPQFMTNTGSITFTQASQVTGGPVRAEFSGGLVPYAAPSTGLRPLIQEMGLGPQGLTAGEGPGD